MGALIIRSGKALLVRRAAPPDQGKWAIPGGKVELGEGLLRAAERELEEETGLRCKALGVVNVDEIITRDNGKVKYHYVLITVLMDSCKGSPRPGSDALEVAEMDIVEAATRPDVAESTRRFLAKILEGRVQLSRPIEVLTSSPP